MAVSSRDAFLREISYSSAREWLLYFNERIKDTREWVYDTCEWISNTRERVYDTRE